MSEKMYAIRRTDGDLIYGEFSFLVTTGPDDWSGVDEIGYYDDSVTYEMCEMTVEVVATRTWPECAEGCGETAEFWGLCRKHAEEDDPEGVRERDAAAAS